MPIEKSQGEIGAVQSIERAGAILRVVAAGGLTGVRLKDIAQQLDLMPSTAHRFCKALVAEGWLAQPAGQKRYFLGGFQQSLASLVIDRTRVTAFGRKATQNLANLTGDTAFLFLREGLDIVCTARSEGDFHIRALAVNVGDWRPLGAGYAGIAVLSTLPLAELSSTLELLTLHRAELAEMDRNELNLEIETARGLGFAETDQSSRLPPGTSGVAAPILFPNGYCPGALGVAAINDRLPTKRRRSIAESLMEECRQIVEDTMNEDIRVDANGRIQNSKSREIAA